jgi:molecular chaperone DnaK (HSP70)
MTEQKTAFGIDFGTTNTRVAYYDGKHLSLVQFTNGGVQSQQFRTLVSYKDGVPVAFGKEAETKGVLLSRPIKWLLDQDHPVEIDGGQREPVDIVTDFFRHLRQLVGNVIKSEKFNRAAITIPVHFPPRARQRLQEACSAAGIEITHFFFEPIAAMYCSLVGTPTSGIAAVFDWGGGSLDIATIKLENGIALTQSITGWHRGGSDFDRLICEQALADFLIQHPLPGATAQTILDHSPYGPKLRTIAETAKIDLARDGKANVSYSGLLHSGNLDYTLRQKDFEDIIHTDVEKGVAILKQACHDTGLAPRMLTRLFLSGGTCQFRFIANRLTQEVQGERITDRLELPTSLRGPISAGLDKISNATALGAALLAAQGASPVFASSIGVRHADASGDRFYPVFHAGEALNFSVPKVEKYFISDARGKVARLLICDQNDQTRQPGGRLLRIVAIPIATHEKWLNVTFTLDRDLVLRVKAEGANSRTFSEPEWIQHLNLGFRLPA